MLTSQTFCLFPEKGINFFDILPHNTTKPNLVQPLQYCAKSSFFQNGFIVCWICMYFIDNMTWSVQCFSIKTENCILGFQASIKICYDMRGAINLHRKIRCRHLQTLMPFCHFKSTSGGTLEGKEFCLDKLHCDPNFNHWTSHSAKALMYRWNKFK